MDDDLLGKAMKAAEMGWSYMNMANTMFAMYTAFKESGFDKEQALTLTIAVIHEMIAHPLPPKKEEEKKEDG